MDWKDTVKHKKGCAANMNPHLDRPVKCDCGAEAQAKITWEAREPEIAEARKAGQEESKPSVLQVQMAIDRAREAGIKEVVEWIRKARGYKMKQEELRKKLQGWVDNRFGVPNTFNTQLLVDFRDWLIKEAGYVKLADDQSLPKTYHTWIAPEVLRCMFAGDNDTVWVKVIRKVKDE